MYKLGFPDREGKVTSIKRLSDGVFIAVDEANTDYQAYLKWLEEGNEPEPAEEPTNN